MKSLKLLLLISLTILNFISTEDKGVAKFRIGKDFTNGVLKTAVSSAFIGINTYLDTLTEFQWSYGSLISFEFTKLKIDHLVYDEKNINIEYLKDSIKLNISKYYYLSKM